MKGRDPYDYSRQVQSGKSMGEFGPDYKKTHDLVLGNKSDKFTGEWNKWKVKKKVHVKKKRKRRSLSNVPNMLGKWLNRLIN